MPEKVKKEGRLESVTSGMDSLKIYSCSILLFFVIIVIVLLFSDAYYLAGNGVTLSAFCKLLSKKEILDVIILSLTTSFTTLALVAIFSIPTGYSLSRYRFPCRSFIETIVDIPIVLPPVVIGVSLLAFFGSDFGIWIKDIMDNLNLSLKSGIGIVLCQFLVSISYCIRSVKSAFDDVDTNLEDVSLVLGCSNWKSFWKVSVPLAKNGIIAGLIVSWARALGVFGPLMVLVGTSAKVQVMPTAIWLQLSIGKIETSLAIALIMVILSGVALTLVHIILPGRNWS